MAGRRVRRRQVDDRSRHLRPPAGRPVTRGTSCSTAPTCGDGGDVAPGAAWRPHRFIPQTTHLAQPGERIGEQIGAVLRRRLGFDRRAAEARAVELLGEVAIRDSGRVMRQYPHEISGGMRQRILIAIAFCRRPHLVVADEPTTAST